MAVQYDEWMSDADALMWHIERDPVLRSTVTSVWVLDQLPDPERLEGSFSRALAKIPRLRQRVVADGLGVATPRWEEDPLFDRSFHLRRIRVPGAGTLRELLDVAAPLAGQAFDKDRPLWDFTLVEGLEGGKSGVILRLHHAVTDGVGMVRMTTSLIERTREPRPGRDRPDTLAEQPFGGARSSDLEQLAQAFQHRVRTATERTGRAGSAVGRGVRDFMRDPVGSARRLADTAGSVGRLIQPADQPLSPLWTDRSFSVHLDALVIPFDAFRAAAKNAGGTLNDAFVAAVAGGIARYHEAHGKPVEELRMNMPINIRDETGRDRAGNQFIPARFKVPMAISNPKDRIHAIQRLVRSTREEAALPLMDEVSGAINRLGVLAATRFVGSMMKTVDFVTSNVPGPPSAVYMAGARIENMFPFGPLAGSAVNVTLFSYDGQLQLGINADRVTVPDPELLRSCIEQGIAEVAAVS
jgi:WS/DGAT/MGAT family acyltransferase